MKDTLLQLLSNRNTTVRDGAGIFVNKLTNAHFTYAQAKDSNKPCWYVRFIAIFFCGTMS